jgi:DNA-binding response OmpR family regulator
MLAPPFTPGRIVRKTREVVRQISPTLDPEAGTILQHEDLVVDLGLLEAFVGEDPIPLTRTEFAYLSLFVRAPGTVFSRGRLVDSFGSSSLDRERSVDVVIRGLRKKLGARGNQIETIRGRGYCLGVPGAR